MDPKFRSSFIPKKPLPVKSSGEKIQPKKSFNLFSFLSALIFITALGLSGAAFGYERVMENAVSDKGLQLKSVMDSLDTERIEEYRDLAQKIDLAKELVGNHRAFSSFFEMLNERTLHSIGYTEIGFEESQAGGEFEVLLEGVAGTYNALALQSDIFKQEDVIDSFTFTEIRIDNRERIIFEVIIKLNTKALLYDGNQL